MNKKISIIIPIYNSEKYINKCIDSILNQTYKDYELILINDGSKDNSLNIIKDYEKKYDFIKVYDQKNSGPAVTRTNGIKYANTPYIMFIDSDDYLDEDYIKSYIDNIDGYDVVVGGYKKVDDNKTLFIRRLNKEGEFSKYVVPAPYCHLYRKEFLTKNKIILRDTLMSEDILFNLEVFSYNPKIKVIDNISYNYYTNLNSISNTAHKGFNEKIDFLDFVNTLFNIKEENNDLHEYFIIRYIIWYLLYSGKGVSKIRFYNHYKKYFNWLKENISNYRKNKYIKIRGPKGEIPKIGFIIWMFIKLDQLHLIKLFSLIYCRGKDEE